MPIKLKKGIKLRQGVKFKQVEQPGMKKRENYRENGYSILVRNKQMQDPETHA